MALMTSSTGVLQPPLEYFGVFAKYWEPGRVKTRLAATVGDQSASVVYCQFLRFLVRRFDQCGDIRIVCFTPEDRSEPFAELGGNHWKAVPQATGNLGQRMAAYFDSCFDQGAKRVVLIGSDSPTLPLEHVESAFQVLSSADVVLGPTDDGGYYLVGMSRNVNEIFSDIDWSTPRVWEQTVARLAELGLSYEVLPGWYDVDDESDLRRLQHELQSDSTVDPAASDLLAAIHSALQSN